MLFVLFIVVRIIFQIFLKMICNIYSCSYYISDVLKISFMSVNDDFLEVYFNLLDDEQRRPLIKSTDNMYADAVKSPSKRKGYMKIQDELLLGSVDEAYTMATDLKDNGKKHTVVVANGDCIIYVMYQTSCQIHSISFQEANREFCFA